MSTEDKPEKPSEESAEWHWARAKGLRKNGFTKITSPPSESASDLADFQSRHGEAPRFAGKGQGNCTWSMPDGTIRRSFSRTAAGKLAGWKGGSYGRGER